MFSVSNKLASICDSPEAFWNAFEQFLAPENIDQYSGMDKITLKKEGDHVYFRFEDSQLKYAINKHEPSNPFTNRIIDFTDNVKRITEVYRSTLNQAIHQGLENCELTMSRGANSLNAFCFLRGNNETASVDNKFEWDFLEPLFVKFLSSVGINSVIKANNLLNSTITLSLERSQVEDIENRSNLQERYTIRSPVPLVNSTVFSISTHAQSKPSAKPQNQNSNPIVTIIQKLFR